MDLGLRGKSFVVTGGSRGLGFATAEALATEGAHTMLVAREGEQLDRAVATLGDDHVGLVADLASPEAASRIAAEAGAVDGLLVNVGGPAPGALMELNDDDWQRAFEGVFMASLRLMRAFIPQIRPGGAILAVLSSTAKEPLRELGASNALRPGLAMAVKDLADTVAPALRVNAILPGRIATDRLREVMGGDLAAGIPLGRPGDPAEFGRVAAFLLSPAASYITGALIPVDGGLLRSPW